MSIVRLGFHAVTALALTHAASAQALTGPGGPVAPLSFVSVTLTNDTGGFLPYPAGCELRLLRHTGDLAGNPLLPGQTCDGILGLAPGQSTSLTIQAPAAPGSYVLWHPYGGGAVTKLDVSAPTPGARTIQFFPQRLRHPQGAHVADFANPSFSPWTFTNTGASTFTFSGPDRIEIRLPGSAAPVATLSLAALSVPAGKALDVDLPIGGLAPVPYEVVALFTDSGGSTVVDGSGIRSDTSRVDLHLRRGHVLTAGGQLEMAVSHAAYDGSPPSSVAYGVAVGFAVGTTPLPGGALVPLFPDPLVLDSLATGIGGLFVNNLGVIDNVYPAPAFFFEGAVEGITLDHPGTPGLAGTVIRMAAFTLDTTTGAWSASQPERVSFQ